jgi:hypothetical protein
MTLDDAIGTYKEAKERAYLRAAALPSEERAREVRRIKAIGVELADRVCSFDSINAARALYIGAARRLLREER